MRLLRRDMRSSGWHRWWAPLARVASVLRAILGPGVGPAYPPPHRAVTNWLVRGLFFLSVAYVSLSTADIVVAGIPLKLVVVGTFLVVWTVSVSAWRDWHARFPLAIPVLTIGLLIPLAWFLVALVLHRSHDQSQGSGLHLPLQEASRFVYVLLYFPLVAQMTSSESDEPSHLYWLLPVFALCVITWGLYVADGLFGATYGYTGQGGPFSGTILVDSSGTFRCFLVNDVLLVPSLVVLLARMRRAGPSLKMLLGVALLLSCAFFAHTRGIWLGLSVAVALMAAVSWTASRPQSVRRVVGVLISGGLFAALIVSAAPNIAPHLVGSVTKAHELSTSERIDEASQLWRGIRHHLLLGTGLGATLPSGFTLDPAAPWAFELTYLELWYHTGIIGLVLLLTAPVMAMQRLVARLPHLHGGQRELAVGALGGLVGLMIAVAGNPYLVTSVGMFALALLLALTTTATLKPSNSPFAPTDPAHRNRGRAIAITGQPALRAD